jgi:hypothetical protein
VAALPHHPVAVRLKQTTNKRVSCVDRFLDGEMDGKSIALQLKARRNLRERYLKPALDAGLIEMTIPDKPNSRLQKYRLSKKGKEVLQ